MNDTEKARERFVSHEAINHGKTQCMDCGHFENWECSILKASEAGKYACNSEPCPHKTKKH